MPQDPRCPECRTVVQPSWDWCLACGFDPEGLKPTTWTPGAPAGRPAAVAVSTAGSERIAGPSAATALVADARPQAMSDPDWLQPEPRRRLSYLGTLGVLAAILIAIGCLVVVIMIVLHRPVGASQADALGAGPVASASPLSGPGAAATG